MVTLACGEPSRPEGSLPMGALLTWQAALSCRGRTWDFLMTLMHCDIALFQAVHLLVLF